MILNCGGGAGKLQAYLFFPFLSFLPLTSLASSPLFHFRPLTVHMEPLMQFSYDVWGAL